MYPFAGPAEVKGFYQNIRKVLQPILIFIFIMLPWLRYQEKPFFLLDILRRHFIVFGFSFYSHDTPLLFFLIILVVLSIFMVTAIFGRLWCGWTCPHTVFIHAIFDRLEKLVMGLYSSRRTSYKLDQGFKKNFKLGLLLSLYFLTCWILSHSALAYFIGSENTLNYISEGPSKHFPTFFTLMLVTGLLFFNFAFFREKTCLYICPYGRFQNSLIDSNTLTVFYDKMRGEPRGPVSRVSMDKGDCVDCNRCVNVCPVKIDIRVGFQMECISCAKCIDACNEVMHKTHRKPHLIRFETADQKPASLKRFRLGLYLLLIILFSGGFIWSLSHRSELNFEFSRAHTSPFSSRLDQGNKIIQNQLQLHIKNQTIQEVTVTLDLSESDKLKGYRIMSLASNVVLQPEQDLKTTAFIEIDEKLYDRGYNQITVILRSSHATIEKPFQFIRVE